MTAWDQYGCDYDLPDYRGVPRIYLIATTPRCGSHYLGHMIRATGVLGCPMEYFSIGRCRDWDRILGTVDPVERYRQLFRRRTSPTGWFGVKAHWSQFQRVVEDSVLRTLFPFQRFIYVVRQNKVAQAVSLVVAQQTSSWISFQPPRCTPRYDGESISHAIDAIESQSRTWEVYFKNNNIEPIRVVYEELVENVERTTTRILSAFGLSGSQTHGQFDLAPVRQATSVNQIWEERFLAEHAPHGTICKPR